MDIKCTQCGAKVPIEEDTTFIRCPFCETALYVDADHTFKRFFMRPQLRNQDIAPNIQRALSYMEIKDPVNVETAELVYFPFWKLDTNLGAAVTVPATTPDVEDMFSLKIPTGDVKLYSDEAVEGHEAIEPEMMLEEALIEGQKILESKTAKFKSASMVHLPLLKVRYACQSKRFAATVEAVSGKVYADMWPAPASAAKDRALGMIALLALVLFFLEAAILPHPALVFPAYALTAGGVYVIAMRTLRKMGW